MWQPRKPKTSDAFGGWLPELVKGVNQPFVDAADHMAPNAGIGDAWDGGWAPIEDRVDDPFDSSTHDEDKAGKAALDKMIGQWEGLTPPELQDVHLEDQTYLGDFTPGQLADPEHLTAQNVEAPEHLMAQGVNALPDVRYEAATLSPEVRAERAALAKMGQSAMEGIHTDPALRDAQVGALGKLDDIIAGGGLTARDRANLERIRGETAAADRGRRDAILQNMAARGMGGSGMELLAQLQSNQAATDRNAQAGLETAAQAEDRALQALMQKGELAGRVRGQDFDQDARVAAAHDAIDQFNAAAANSMGQFNAGQGNSAAMFNAGQANDMSRFNAGNTLQTALANRDYQTNTAKFNAGEANQMGRFNVGNDIDVGKFNAGETNQMGRFNVGNDIDVGKFNVGAQNAAGMAGWQARQGVANANTDTHNKQTIYNTAEKPKAQFDMAAQKTNGLGNAYGKESDFWTAAGNRKAAKAGAMMGGAATLGAGALMAFAPTAAAAAPVAASDERTKKDVSDISDSDLDEFFAALQPKTYRYKDRYANGDSGGKAGFMMQDVGDTKLGQVIEREGPDGMRAYDPQAVQGIILAALKKISEEG